VWGYNPVVRARSLAITLFTLALACGDDVDPETGSAGSGGTVGVSTGSGTGSDPGTGTDTGGEASCDDLDPVAGCPGSGCMQSDDDHEIPWCNEGNCNLPGMFCFDPEDPCRGVDCGGAERGMCSGEMGVPYCVCNEGYDFMMFSLYCY
jgi:hypothetical protein